MQKHLSPLLRLQSPRCGLLHLNQDPLIFIIIIRNPIFPTHRRPFPIFLWIEHTPKDQVRRRLIHRFPRAPLKSVAIHQVHRNEAIADLAADRQFERVVVAAVVEVADRSRRRGQFVQGVDAGPRGHPVPGNIVAVAFALFVDAGIAADGVLVGGGGQVSGGAVCYWGGEGDGEEGECREENGEEG